jgi:squalene-hopene/tetraprenyl-beta-curcumene cyclase
MELDAARSAAVDFLVGARDSRGWWSDFDTLAGKSDEWVTAYVGSTLARLSDEPAQQAARDAWQRLRVRRRWRRGWGYNRFVPPDADSTIWSLSLAEALGLRPTLRVRRALHFLSTGIDAQGGVATFPQASPIRRFTRLSGATGFAGWCSPHVCVSAAAAGLRSLPERASVLQFVRRSQAPDGTWPAYWWEGSEYSTALAVEALAGCAALSDARRVEHAAATMGRRIAPDGAVRSTARPNGSAFATACVGIVMACAPESAATNAGLRGAFSWLITNQARNGSWEASAYLRIPPPAVVDPDQYQHWTFGGRGGGSIVVDFGVYTTATVLRALCTAPVRIRELAGG